MALSLLLYPAADDELRRFERDPATLTAWLRGAGAEGRGGGASLHEYWRSLHALLTQPPRRPELPWSALVSGDLRFPSAGARGGHGCLGATVRALARAVGQLPRPEIESFAQEEWAEFARKTGRAAEITGLQLRSRTEELVLYLYKLRAVAERAALVDQGLLFLLREDW